MKKIKRRSFLKGILSVPVTFGIARTDTSALKVSSCCSPKLSEVKISGFPKRLIRGEDICCESITTSHISEGSN